jgi:hypothetical protein
MLPREVFNRIASYLDRTDTFALSVTSKGLYTLTEKLLYSAVTLTSNDAVLKYTRTLAARFSLWDLVLIYLIGDEIEDEPCAGCVIEYNIK